ncbi:MAG: hypothetical protein ABIQ00_16490 [Chitinophagaceae bacterium]
MPSKALIPIARQMQAALEAQSSGISLSSEVDIQKAIGYVYAPGYYTETQKCYMVNRAGNTRSIW